MYEIDFLPVGDGARSGDAIALRFTRPDNNELAHVIIDGGFEDDGEALVEHVKRYYETEDIDLVVLTHPDGDHIGGLGVVLRELNVAVLAAHDLAAHGGGSLKAAEATTELIELARSEGTSIYEPFEGFSAFGGALLVAGPSKPFYEACVAEQVAQEVAGARASEPSSALREAIARLSARVLSIFPLETDFGDSGGTNPRNNSSTIIDVSLEGERFFFTGDAGVPALEAALDYLDAAGRTEASLKFAQVPHHGSRHNGSRAHIERLLGPHTSEERGSAVVSISRAASEDPRYPSPRITNAYGRRGFKVAETAGQTLCLASPDAPDRGWHPVPLVPPRDESIDDRP